MIGMDRGIEPISSPRHGRRAASIISWWAAVQFSAHGELATAPYSNVYDGRIDRRRICEPNLEGTPWCILGRNDSDGDLATLLGEVRVLEPRRQAAATLGLVGI